MHQSDTVYFSN